MRVRADIPTPALLLDLDRFEANVARMAAHLRDHGKAFRPHGKTHKCPEIARRLIAAGAVGSCTARLSEAEVFAEHGIPGLLITTAVVGAAKIARAVDLAARAPDTVFSVESEQNVHDLSVAAARVPGLVLNLAIDLYFGRTGVAPGAPAQDLARVITKQRRVRFAGLQAYDGAAAHTAPFDARRARSSASLKQAVDTRRLIERDGIECPLVSGGSTGTCLIDADIEGVTEIQPGSFVFMDLEYAGIGGPDGPEYRTFSQSLTVVATVVSRHPGVAIVDAGYKAFATDRPFTPAPVHLPGATYAWAGDEHGRVDVSRVDRDVRVGDRIEFVPPHCDPTVNLYDQIYALRGDTLEGVWPIAARGRSQ
ncbi:MAG: DSD1 family PLP-dependent enzyme [Acidobacteriota bacterium]|nr:DSD1 family PLP-dependent enzyme [Acidobacteriota bacterium]